MKLARRRFLKGLGGATIGLPLLSGPRRALAQTAATPKNAIFFWTPNGFNMSTFFPRARHNGGSSAFGPLTVADAFAARPLDTSDDQVNGVPRSLFRHPEWGLRRLSGFSDRLSVVRGMRNSRLGFRDLAGGGDHGMNTACRFTAAGIGSGRGLALGRSVDYAIAERINPLVDNARLPMVLHVGSNSDPRNGDGTSFVSYRGSEDPDPGINNPWTAYRRLMDIEDGSPAEDFLTRRRQRVADLVRGELNDLQSSVARGGRDRRMITDWLGLLESTEDDMRNTNLMCTTATRDSIAPESAVSGFAGQDNGELGRWDRFEQIGDLMIRIIALSILCGHTHVATLQWSAGAGGPAFGDMNMGDGEPGTWHTGERHHELSHRNGTDGADAGFLPDVERNMSWIDQWYGGKYRDLLQYLDDFDLLDDSAVVWMPEFGDGRQHHYIEIAAVVAGSAGGYLRTGEMIDVSANGRWDERLDPETNGPAIVAAGNPANVYDLAVGGSNGTTSHNRLLTTLYNAVLPRDADGNPEGAINRFPEQDTADSNNQLEAGELTGLRQS